VGTLDGTKVTVTASSLTTLGPGTQAPGLGPGQSFQLKLDDGDVFQGVTGADGDDLSGSEILADGPVAVFSGNITTTYGRTSPPGAPAVSSPDMAHEQMPRVGAWSRRYVAAALPPQAGVCNSLFGLDGASLWRILAASDGTHVSFEAPVGVAGLPASDTVLNAGQVLELVVTGGSFVMTATNPVMMTQGIDCEPTLSLAVPADGFLANLWFATLPGFDQRIAVARPTGQRLELDEVVVPDGMFAAVSPDIEIASFELPACPPSALVCAHHLAGTFGMTMRGMDVVCSYALTVSPWNGCIDFVDPTCVF
jgi:hypothetical protein